MKDILVLGKPDNIFTIEITNKHNQSDLAQFKLIDKSGEITSISLKDRLILLLSEQPTKKHKLSNRSRYWRRWKAREDRLLKNTIRRNGSNPNAINTISKKLRRPEKTVRTRVYHFLKTNKSNKTLKKQNLPKTRGK